MANCIGSGARPKTETKQPGGEAACSYCGQIRPVRQNGTVENHLNLKANQ